MRVLTLKQPWASALMIGAKGWETRSWKPSMAMLHILRIEGMYIHSSVGYKDVYKSLLSGRPFNEHFNRGETLPTGCILGHVLVGRVIATTDWMKEFQPDINETAYEEWQFGNYSPDRWAWEIVQRTPWEQPVKAKGALSLWQCKEEFPKSINRSL